MTRGSRKLRELYDILDADETQMEGLSLELWQAKARIAKLEAERERLRRALEERFQKEEGQLIDAHRQEAGRVWARIVCMEGYAD